MTNYQDHAKVFWQIADLLRGPHLENAYSMKLKEHLLAIAAKFRLVPTLKSLTLSHHNGALP